MFSRESQPKPSFATVTGKGDNSNYISIHFHPPTPPTILALRVCQDPEPPGFLPPFGSTFDLLSQHPFGAESFGFFGGSPLVGFGHFRRDFLGSNFGGKKRWCWFFALKTKNNPKVFKYEQAKVEWSIFCQLFLKILDRYLIFLSKSIPSQHFPQHFRINMNFAWEKLRDDDVQPSPVTVLDDVHHDGSCDVACDVGEKRQPEIKASEFYALNFDNVIVYNVRTTTFSI